MDADARQTTCPANTVYAQLCLAWISHPLPLDCQIQRHAADMAIRREQLRKTGLESEQYGRMCQAWPLPYGDGGEFVAQYDHMPAGEYTMYAHYQNVGGVNGEIILTGAGAFWDAGPEPEETAASWPTPTRLVSPSPTPRATRSVATPTRSGASNPDAIIDEGTLTIGWVGPALLGILIAAFGWAGRVFEWLGTLATWLFSGEWRGGGEV